jgi:hypothetical protein
MFTFTAPGSRLSTNILSIVGGCPPLWSFIGLIMYLSTLLVSMELYPCSPGSAWCWMTAGLGTVTVLIAFALQVCGNGGGGGGGIGTEKDTEAKGKKGTEAGESSPKLSLKQVEVGWVG